MNIPRASVSPPETAQPTAFPAIYRGTVVRGRYSFMKPLLTSSMKDAVYGSAAGLWLGFVFGMVVLLSGDSAAFFAFSVPGTLLTVLVKGIACGGLAGGVYAWLAQKNRTLAAVTAAIVCPVVNTGVFLLGCRIFFLPMLADMAQNLGFGDNVGRFMIIGLVGVNFLAELGINIVLSPVILRLIRIGRKEN